MNNNNLKLVQALEPLGIPIFYKQIPEDALENLNYISYRETQLLKDKQNHFIQLYEVAFISQYKDDLLENEMITALENNNFNFKYGVYDTIKLASTADYIDIFVMTISKPIKRKRC